MSRIMTITMEVNDDEAASLLARFAERGVTAVSGDTPTPAAANVSDTDANGVVWDARYHASTRNTNQDGSWKALRGMDDATKAAAAAYEASFANPAPAEPTEPEPETESDETIPVFLQKPASPTMPAATPVAAPVSFEELSAGFQTVIEKIGAPALMEKLGAIYEAAGVDSAGTSLTTNETQRAQVLTALKAL